MVGVFLCPNCNCPIFPGEECCPDCSTRFTYPDKDDIVPENVDWNKNYYVISFLSWFVISLAAFVFGFAEGSVGIIIAILVSLFMEVVLFYIVPKFMRVNK